MWRRRIDDRGFDVSEIWEWTPEHLLGTNGPFRVVSPVYLVFIRRLVPTLTC
jgi:hypothetical protein